MTTLRVLVGVLVTGIAGGSMLAAQAQTVVYVDSDATGAVHDGSSWCAAFLYLQDAFAVAENSGGDVSEIRVAGGVYKADQGANETPGDKAATFHLISGVEVYGGFAGCGAHDPDERNFQLYESVLDGDLADDDDPWAPHGSSNCCRGEHGEPGCDDTSCEALVCDVYPLCCESGWSGYCSRLALGLCCEFCTDKNYCENTWHVVEAGGVGIDETTVLDGFTITAGHAIGMFPDNRGGGMTCTGIGSATVQNCIFRRNLAIGGGGGMSNYFGCSPTVINCVFTGNEAWHGGGLYGYHDCNVTVVNSTFSGNSAAYGGAGWWVMIGTVTMTNSIVWGNQGGQISFNWEPVIDYSCVGGRTGLAGTGNFSDDPLLMDARGPDGLFGTADDDVRLSRASPCIDAGDNTAVPASITIDLDRSPRFVDILSVSDTGNGTPPIVDLGAYEYFADCNDNDVEDEQDIVNGTSDDCNYNLVPDECEADADNDGLIDVCDPCPQDPDNDADNDGVCVPEDQCPSDPNKTEPGICGCGVSDVDDDGDGVPTCVDVCPGVDDAVFAPNCTDPIPTISTWGLVTLLLVLLTAGKLCFGWRRLAK